MAEAGGGETAGFVAERSGRSWLGKSFFPAKKDFKNFKCCLVKFRVISPFDRRMVWGLDMGIGLFNDGGFSNVMGSFHPFSSSRASEGPPFQMEISPRAPNFSFSEFLRDHWWLINR